MDRHLFASFLGGIASFPLLISVLTDQVPKPTPTCSRFTYHRYLSPMTPNTPYALIICILHRLESLGVGYSFGTLLTHAKRGSSPRSVA